MIEFIIGLLLGGVGVSFIGVLRKNSDTLTSVDGKFQCAPDHAVEVAYFMSTAEAVIDRCSWHRSEIGDVLADYCEGRITSEEAHRQLLEEFE